MNNNLKTFEVTGNTLVEKGIWGIRAFNLLERNPKEVCRCLSKIYGEDGRYTYVTIIPREEIIVLKECLA